MMKNELHVIQYLDCFTPFAMTMRIDVIARNEAIQKIIAKQL